LDRVEGSLVNTSEFHVILSSCLQDHPRFSVSAREKVDFLFSIRHYAGQVSGVMTHGNGWRVVIL